MNMEKRKKKKKWCTKEKHVRKWSFRLPIIKYRVLHEILHTTTVTLHSIFQYSQYPGGNYNPSLKMFFEDIIKRNIHWLSKYSTKFKQCSLTFLYTYCITCYKVRCICSLSCIKTCVMNNSFLCQWKWLQRNNIRPLVYL